MAALFVARPHCYQSSIAPANATGTTFHVDKVSCGMSFPIALSEVNLVPIDGTELRLVDQHEKSHRKILQRAGRHAMFLLLKPTSIGWTSPSATRSGNSPSIRTLGRSGRDEPLRGSSREAVAVLQRSVRTIRVSFRRAADLLGRRLCRICRADFARRAGRDAGLALIPTVASKSKVCGVACLSRVSG